jgi:hypothetical protein
MILIYNCNTLQKIYLPDYLLSRLSLKKQFYNYLPVAEC